MKRFLSVSGLGELKGYVRGEWDGVLFGAEFCGHRLPTVAEAVEARSFCRSEGIAFVPVTPVAVESQFDEVCDWLGLVAEAGGEWVANDLGVLKWAHERGLSGRATAGRMLSRQQRGPRLARMLSGADPVHAARLKGSLWDDPLSIDIFVEFGAIRFALDAVAWGLTRPALPKGASLVVHAPYAVVTWSPWCHFRGGDFGPCAAPCATAEPLRLENEEEPTPLYTRGNAIFSRLEEALAVRVAEEAGAERLIWSPGIPA